MALKAITFLGTATYNQTKYTYETPSYEKQSHDGKFIAEAIVHFFEPEVLYVVVTPEAKERYWDELVQKLAASQTRPITPILIGIERPITEEDIWKVFGAIAAENVLASGDHLVLDLTNGFRSIPILALFASLYLRTARNITLEALTYGEHDQEKGETPLRDLTPFVKLLDWTNATNMFLETGRATELVELTTANAKGSALDDFAKHLQTLSLELTTTRPAATMEAAAKLPTKIEAAKVNLPLDKQPIGLLLDRIGTDYQRFGLPDPTKRVQGRHNLAIQLDMIDWYLDKELPIQAMTLAREWLVSLVRYYQGESLFADYKSRNRIARWIDPPEANETDHLALLGIPELQSALTQIRNSWTSVTLIRNDVAHCGMGLRRHLAAEIRTQVVSICEQLRLLLPPEAE